jgi:hypothetical protein
MALNDQSWELHLAAICQLVSAVRALVASWSLTSRPEANGR